MQQHTAVILKPLPMLATKAQPFDDPRWLFEIKWDGVRCLAAVDSDKVRLWGREGASYSGRYPELDAALSSLPPGTIVDGELVMLRGCVPDFHALMSRHASRPGPLPRKRELVQFVAFDLLRLGDISVMERPLIERRELLQAHFPAGPVLSVCEGVVGKGKDAFAAAIAAGHEGIVAKRLASTYQPNKRGWQKVKQAMKLACVVIGYKAVRCELRELLMATSVDGELRYVGNVELGVEQEMLAGLSAIRVAKPVVECPSTSALWVAPEVLGVVHFAGWRPGGWWRDAIFNCAG